MGQAAGHFPYVYARRYIPEYIQGVQKREFVTFRVDSTQGRQINTIVHVSGPNLNLLHVGNNCYIFSVLSTFKYNPGKINNKFITSQ